MSRTTSRELELLFQISIDLTASFSSQDRHQRLVDSVRSALQIDAVTLMRHQDGVLHPVAQHGLSRDALGREFQIHLHPRLERIVSIDTPTIFPHDSDLPDPFDGLIEGAPILTGQVHACVGCPLHADGKLIGVLTLDALHARHFDDIGPAFFSSLAALTGASLRTALLIEALEKARHHQDLVATDQVKASRERHGASLIGDSPQMQQLSAELRAIGPSDLPVLITGETGVGKEPTVRQLHAVSARANKPLVYVNCAALPESLAESELFGHVRGAFTDARQERLGKFQIADNASLFLDEIGELPLSIQPKLLRVLQSGEVQSVGSDRTRQVNVRVFAATNRDLRAEVQAGSFRADLLHRLDVCRVHVPALRQHPSDIPPLAGHFCDSIRRRLGSGPVRLDPRAQQALESYLWPGNVRELENVISRAVLRAKVGISASDTVVLHPRHLGEEFRGVARNSVRDPVEAAPTPMQPDDAVSIEITGSLRKSVDLFQTECVRRALAANDGIWSRAAADLDMHRANFHRLAQRLGFKRTVPRTTGPADPDRRTTDDRPHL